MLWEKYVYKFVLFSLCIGLFATVIRWTLVVANGSGDIVEYVGGPIAIFVDALLAFILWRRPQLLRFVGKSIFWFMTLGISVKLVYFLFFSEGRIYNEFVEISPWMYINYLLPFFIFGSRIATVVSSTVFGVWVMISAVYLVIHNGTAETSEIWSVFSQTYFAQCILIVFVALYARLQTFYLDAQKSAGRMELMARTDFLLDIANRRSMQIELTKQIAHAEKFGTSLSVVLMDIDHFKQINDTHGHHVGDAVLIEVSSLLKKDLSDQNFFGRWGGEEFLIILPNCSRMKSSNCAEKIREAFETHHFQIGHVSATFGVAEYREGDNSQSLLKKADHALYNGKQLGRNRVEVG